MQKIWKFELKESKTEQVLKMPKDAQILTARWRWLNMIHVWAIVDPDVTEEERYFEVIETGKSLPLIDADSKRIYIETVQASGFSLHIFEVVHPKVKAPYEFSKSIFDQRV